MATWLPVRLLCILLCLAAVGCGTTHATIETSRGEHLMLLGFDPVGYFEDHKPVRGKHTIPATYDGRTYYFASDTHREAFEKSPAKYEPLYGGFCSNGAPYGVKMGSDPTQFEIRGGRLFIFGDVQGHEMWLLDEADNIKHADELWPSIADKGWRAASLEAWTVHKVPWYRDGKSLMARWKEKHPGQTLDYDTGGTFNNLVFKYPGWRAREGYSQVALGVPGEADDPVKTPDGLAGHWSGTWTKASDPLGVTMSIERTQEAGHYSGSFSSERLRVSGIPFSVARVTGCCAVHMEVVGDETTTKFDGRLEGDRMSGSFSDGRDSGTFAFQRDADTHAAIREEAVSFSNGAAKLSGTLLLPAAMPPYPAIVFLHGSGPEGRWANRYLASRLAREGIAALVYDKRGVGSSTGDWRQAGFDDLAADAAAGVAMLRGRPDVDGKRIGLYGHSQGATYMPLAVQAAAPVAFVVASAPSGVSMEELERFSVLNAFNVKSLPADQAAHARSYVDALVRAGYRGEGRGDVDRMSSEFSSEPWYQKPPPADSWWWNFARRTGSFHPPTQWKQVHAPVLLLFGARDERVPAKASADAITASLAPAGGPATTLCTYPDADHTMRVRRAGDAWPHDADGFMDDLVQWIRNRAGLSDTTRQSSACISIIGRSK